MIFPPPPFFFLSKAAVNDPFSPSKPSGVLPQLNVAGRPWRLQRAKAFRACHGRRSRSAPLLCPLLPRFFGAAFEALAPSPAKPSPQRASAASAVAASGNDPFEAAPQAAAPAAADPFAPQPSSSQVDPFAPQPSSAQVDPFAPQGDVDINALASDLASGMALDMPGESSTDAFDDGAPTGEDPLMRLREATSALCSSG